MDPPPTKWNTAIHDTILETAAGAGIPFRLAHGVINAEQAFYLVSQRAGGGYPTEAEYRRSASTRSGSSTVIRISSVIRDLSRVTPRR